MPREPAFASIAELTHLSSIRLEPMTISLKPGAQTVVQAHMYNESARVDHFTVELEGLPRDWVRMADPSVQLMPDKETTFRFTILAPMEGTRAQTYPYRLILRSSSDQRIEGHAFGNLLVEPAPRFTASLNPVRVKNSGSTQVVIQNSGNTEQRFTVLAQDENEAVLFDQMACRVTMPPGREERVNFKVGSAARPYFGSGKKSHPFQFQILPVGGEPKTQAGQLEVSPRFPKWMIMFVIAIFGISLPLGLLSANNLKKVAAQNLRNEVMQIDNTAMTAEAARVATNQAVGTATATAQIFQTMVAAEAATATIEASDLDGDGLSLAEEREFGSDPANSDSDNDGLSDIEEEEWGSDPNVNDTDKDSLFDGDEVKCNPNSDRPVAGECTSPVNADSDGDTIPDPIDEDSILPPTLTPTPEVNLLNDNDSFESSTYGFVIRSTGDGSHANEIMVPVGWQFLVNDNAPVDNNPSLLYLFPEMKPQERANLNECSDDDPTNDAICEIFHRDQVVKVFKGGAPIRFALFKTMPLPPGQYRFTIDFFADTVWGYGDGGEKEWAPEGFAELHLCVENAVYQHLDWQPVPIGQVSSRFVEFLVPEGQVTLFAMFRNNFVTKNNGWFLDHFNLQRIGDVPAEFTYVPNDLSHNCTASMPGAHESR
jgi:hypothetical protein